MQLIGYNMFGVSRLRALQLSSRYIPLTSPFYVAFWRFTTQTIEIQRFVKCYYAVIAHTPFHAYYATYLLLLCANFKDLYLTDGILNRNE